MKRCPPCGWAVCVLVFVATPLFGSAVETKGADLPLSATQSVSSATSEVYGPANVLGATPASTLMSKIQSELGRIRGSAPEEPGSPPIAQVNAITGTERGVIGRVVGWLVFVIVLLLISAALARRWLGPRLGLSGQEMHLVSSLSLSSKSKIHVVEVDGERFLVGDGGGQISFLAALGEAPEAPPEPEGIDGPGRPPLGGFASRIQSWQQQMSAQGLSTEVRSSLQLFDGLSQRLRRRKGDS